MQILARAWRAKGTRTRKRWKKIKDFLLTLLSEHINNVAEKFTLIFLKMLISFVKGICQTLDEQCQIFGETSRNGL